MSARTPIRRRRRMLLVGVAGAAALVIALALSGGHGGSSRARALATGSGGRLSGRTVYAERRQRLPAPATTAQRRPAVVARRRLPARPRYVEIGETTLRLVDVSRTMVVAGRTAPRTVEAIVRYPIGLHGPFPLVVFGHGFAVSPAPYSLLLNAWTRAGYVVAAPIFPLENADAPGGPDEKDLVNQPGDMSLVISSLSSPDSPAAAHVAEITNFAKIAVTGQSDGGDTALAAAYDPSARDPRITAAMILSGAEDPFARPFTMPPGGPPLLAIQGTDDTINPPYQTYAFFDQASSPKYLLKLLGAGHQPPYTESGPELTLVEHMTLAFLNRYLKGRSSALPRYSAAGSAGPGSVLISQP